MRAAQRVALLGGTFDPPHAGHLAAVTACRQALRPDRFLLVVANDPWQKSPQRPVTPAEDRFAMVVAAAAELEGVEASRMEIDRGGPSYTIETVEQLRAEAEAAGQPTPEILMVVGADLLPTLPTWERARELRRLVTVAVVSRPGSPPSPPPPAWRVVRIDGPQVDVSSSAIRASLAAGLAVDGLVPDAVIRCIRCRGLYAVDR